MSEQTTGTSNGLSDGVEPSMEDILASIRKIIAKDEDNDAVVTSDDNDVINDLSLGAQDNMIPNKDIETLDLDILPDVEPSDSEIDSLIADMDMIDAEAVSAPVIDETMELAVDDILDLEIPMEEDELSVLEDLSLTDTESLKAETLEAVEVDDSSDDELSLMLDEMLNDDVADVEVDASDDFENLELVVDPAEDLLGDEFEADNELQTDTMRTESDMDLVKSLMADLTGEPLHAELNVEADAAVDVEEDIFEALGMDLVEPDAEVDAETDDVMDEILSLSLDDEIEIQADALAAADIEVPLSLKDIAAQAEADADALSGGKALAAVAALGAVAAATQIDEPSIDLDLDLEQALEIETEDELLEVAESDDTDDIDEVLSKFDDIVTVTPEIETPEIEIETPADLNPEEETTLMPRASKKDTIIDEVTETATAGAFASLNQVVEEKAVVAERGDRVGDLVMEALRPMLKDWLDANLKGIVERAVTKEVKRISSGK